MREEINRKYRMKQVVCVILGIRIALILTGSIVRHRIQVVEAKVSKTQEHLAGEVLRFHVPANSDSDEDQAVKLKVRDKVLAYMKESMDAEFKGEEPAVEDTKKWAENHLTALEELAESVIKEEGYSYGASAEVTTCYFPEKVYGDVTFPKGDYEALQIKLGEAKGHNWWCVLYPNLCFIDATKAVVSEEGKEELDHVLTEDEYEMVTSTSDFKIKWFFLGDDSR